MHKRNVFIIGGGGMVGATAAQAIAIKEIVPNIILIDIDQELVLGQAMDINHATAFTNGVNVRVGDYNEIAEDDIVIITCGAAQQPGQTRLELLGTNAKIIESVVNKVMAQGKPVYIVMVANPVDVLTHHALKVSGLPKNRVFGTGTTLDTARLQVTIASALNVSQQEVQAYILGEHGDSSFAALSGASIGGIPLAKFPGFKPKIVNNIDKNIREAAYKIIAAKKSTYFGIGHVMAKIVEAMVRDTGSIFPLCSLAEGEYGLDNVVIGLPSLLNSGGAQILANYPLSQDEQERMLASAKVVRQAMDSIQN